MNHVPFFLDGVLVLIFLVGWIESTGFSAYKWEWRRFWRALSLPLAIGIAVHLFVASRFWVGLVESNSPLLGPLVTVGFGVIIILIVVGPVWMINLTGFVVTQFIATKGVTTIVLGDGDIVFAAPNGEAEVEAGKKEIGR